MGIYNVHGGHNFNVPGASGYFSETEQDRGVKNRVIAGMQSLGHTVYDCTDESGKSQNANLANIVGKCNAHAVSLDISIHFNASNGAGHGVEVLCYDASTSGVAQNVCNAVAALGFSNRGVKYRRDLYVLRSTKSPAILIECCFCDHQGDAAIYNVDAMAQAIVKGITGQVTAGNGASEKPTPQPAPQPGSSPTKDLGQVDAMYQVYTDKWWPQVKNWEDFAGKGDGIAIQYLALSVSKGSVKYRCHSLKNGWLGWVSQYNINDLNNGCAGDGTPMDAVEIYYYTPDGYRYKSAIYRVSDVNHTTYYAEQHDSEKGSGQDGYAGAFGAPIDKLQIKIE